MQFFAFNLYLLGRKVFREVSIKYLPVNVINFEYAIYGNRHIAYECFSVENGSSSKCNFTLNDSKTKLAAV